VTNKDHATVVGSPDATTGGGSLDPNRQGFTQNLW
jgi:hypothetical protein